MLFRSVIKQGGRTYVQGEDFDIVSDGGSPAKAVVRWRPEAAWGAPAPGTNYDLELTKADGTTQTFSNVERGKSDTLTMSEWGFTTAGGTIDPTAAYVYQDPPTAFGGGTFVPSANTGGKFTLTWTQPTTPPVLRMKDGKPITPRSGDEYTVEYKHEKNTFTLRRRVFPRAR